MAGVAQTAVVTGAGRGLGVALSAALRAEGYAVIEATRATGLDLAQPRDLEILLERNTLLDEPRQKLSQINVIDHVVPNYYGMRRSAQQLAMENLQTRLPTLGKSVRMTLNASSKTMNASADNALPKVVPSMPKRPMSR
jgi:NAD(P)-dependent dehydrogenase (short-subunit alcohol dehydrogenase family)